jgi:hypothetical protein
MFRAREIALHHDLSHTVHVSRNGRPYAQYASDLITGWHRCRSVARHVVQSIERDTRRGLVCTCGDRSLLDLTTGAMLSQRHPSKKLF